MREGWICPKCGVALSPDVKQCNCAVLQKLEPPNPILYWYPVYPYPTIPGRWFDPPCMYTTTYPTIPLLPSISPYYTTC